MEFDPQARGAYDALEKAGELVLLDVIDLALDVLEADPGDRRARRRSFGEGLWGFVVRGRSEDVLLIWELDGERGTAVIRYLGPDPFA